MMKLIKGEWFRFTHTGHIFAFMILASLLSLGMVIYSNYRALGMDLAYFAGEFAGTAQALQPFLIAIFIPVVVAKLYSHKTGYYEVMDGSNPALIILSKLIVYSFAAVTIYVFPIAVFFTVIALVNGVGQMDILMYSLMFIVITLRVVLSSVMFTMIIKHGASAFLCYARYFILEIAGLELLIMIFPERAETFTEIFTWLPMTQLSLLAFSVEACSIDFIIKVTVGFAAEAALMFGWTFLNYRNKRFA